MTQVITQESNRNSKRVRNQFFSETSLEIKVCSSQEEKIACQTLSNRLLRDRNYGLRDPKIIEEWLGPLENQTYIAAFGKRGKQPVGTVRLLPDYDPIFHSNLYDELAEFCGTGHRLVDIGVYIPQTAEKKSTLFEKLLTVTAGYLLKVGISGVYIQVKPQQVQTFLRLGFSPATDPFFPKGWSCNWRGMFLRLDQVVKLHGDQNFQESWHKKTSVKLNAAFWSRVAGHLNFAS